MGHFHLTSKVKIIAAFLIFSYVQTFAQRKHVIFESTFEDANAITKWYERSFKNPWSGVVAADRFRAGKGSLKVKLIRGIDVLNGPRAELGMAPVAINEGWYGFSHFIPTEYSNDPASEILNQWQAMPDFILGETWRSPPLALEVKADRYKIAIRWATATVNTAQNTGVDYIDIGPVEHNKWTDWVFHVKWSAVSGTLQIWKNGILIMERTNKPIGYTDKLFPYFKVGIYKWEWSNPATISTSKERAYYIDEIRIGDKLATYNDVVPGGVISLPIEANTLKVTVNADGSYSASFTALNEVPQPTLFILYISSDNGLNYFPTYSDQPVGLIKGKKYNLIFKKK